MADGSYLKGFGVTFKKLFEDRVTGDYRGGKGLEKGKPDEKRPKADRLHGRHVLNRYEDGMEKCIGCELCAGVCPAKCIYVRGRQQPRRTDLAGERFGYVYEINYLRCIHCDLCVEACPTQAITESKLFEFSFTNRSDAIYTKDELLVGDDGKPQQLPWEDWRDGEDTMTSGWMRATSPAGDHRYEGMVHWAGELGYGVRDPEAGQSAEVDDDGELDRQRRASSMAEFITFFCGAAIILAGAIGVVVARNAVHSALFLIQTLLGVAVIFVVQEAHFLAAVQIVVYAGAIVILFLFVIMLLGVDKAEDLGVEPIAGQKPLAVVLGASLLATAITFVLVATDGATGVGSGDPERQLDSGITISSASAGSCSPNTQWRSSSPPPCSPSA